MNLHKFRAREAMRFAGPNLYLVTVIAALGPSALQMIFARIIFGRALSWNVIYAAVQNGEFNQYFNLLSGFQVLYFAVVSLTISLIGALIRYGYTYFCMRASRGEDTNWMDVFYGFSERPLRVIWAEVLISVRVMLWSLLFIIPGIIASFSYVQTYRVMIDNPEMEANEAINCSRDLMRGWKMEYFFLGLSFIGWDILEAMTYGLSAIYSKPYMELTFCSFYDALYNSEVIF